MQCVYTQVKLAYLPTDTNVNKICILMNRNCSSLNEGVSPMASRFVPDHVQCRTAFGYLLSNAGRAQLSTRDLACLS